MGKKYEKIKKADVITKELIAKLYDIQLNNVEGIFYVQIPKLPARMLH